MATILANEKKLNKAMKYFNHALTLKKDSIQAHYGLAKIYMTNPKLQENALWHYKIVTELEESNYKAHCNVGLIYLQKEDYESAAEYFKKCLVHAPKYMKAIIGMGQLLNHAQNFKQAILYFQKALALNPEE